MSGRDTGASGLTAGLAHARKTPAILAVFMVVATVGMFGYNFNVILPLLARFVLDTDATGFGSLASCLGFGSLIAALLTAYAGHVSMRRVLVGAGGFGLILSVLALSRIYALSLALLAGLGFCGIIFATGSNTLLQLLSPDVLRGRIMSVLSCCSWAARLQRLPDRHDVRCVWGPGGAVVLRDDVRERHAAGDALRRHDAMSVSS